jgi:hypothetical protein
VYACPALTRTQLRGREKGVAPVSCCLCGRTWYMQGGYVLCELTALGFITKPHCSAVAGGVVAAAWSREIWMGVVSLPVSAGWGERDGGGMGTRVIANKEQRHQQNQQKRSIEAIIYHNTEAGKAHNTSPVCQSCQTTNIIRRFPLRRFRTFQHIPIVHAPHQSSV